MKIEGVEYEYRGYIPQYDQHGNSMPGIFGSLKLVPSRTYGVPKRSEPKHIAAPRKPKTELPTEKVDLTLVPDGEGFMAFMGTRFDRYKRIPIAYNRWTLLRAERRTWPNQSRPTGFVRGYSLVVSCACGAIRYFSVGAWKQRRTKECSGCYKRGPSPSARRARHVSPAALGTPQSPSARRPRETSPDAQRESPSSRPPSPSAS